MNQEQAFLEAIRQEPDDDTHRLVFADWLEDREDSRAQFIRCQVRAEQHPRAAVERLALEEQARTELESHRHEWLSDLHGTAQAWIFRRGFLDTVRLTLTDFLALPETVFERHPLLSVELVLEPSDRCPNDLADLAACPLLQHLERIGLEHRFLADAPLESLLTSPYLERLRGLNLSGTYVTGRWLGDTLRYPVLQRIEELNLSVCPFLHDRMIRALAGSSQAGILRRLHLGGTALTPFGLMALLRPFKLTRLVDLEIGAMNVPALAEASRRALRELADSPVLANLSTLSLRGGLLDQERTQALFAAPLDQLRELHLIGCELSGAACRPLATTPRLSRLTRLDLAQNRLQPEDLALLADGPLMVAVEQLDLADNAVSNAGLRALATSPLPRRLALLDLARNRINGPGIQALAQAPWAAGLRELNLADNGIGQVGLHALAESATLTGLTALSLALNRLEAPGLGVLANSANLKHLVCLDLSGNPLGDAGVRALAQSPHLARLRRLDLRQTRLGRGGVEALLSSRTVDRLDELDLRGNDITHDEKPRLARRFGGRIML